MAALNILMSPPLRYIEKEKRFDFASAEEVIQVGQTLLEPECDN